MGNYIFLGNLLLAKGQQVWLANRFCRKKFLKAQNLALAWHVVPPAAQRQRYPQVWLHTAGSSPFSCQEPSWLKKHPLRPRKVSKNPPPPCCFAPNSSESLVNLVELSEGSSMLRSAFILWVNARRASVRGKWKARKCKPLPCRMSTASLPAQPHRCLMTSWAQWPARPPSFRVRAAAVSCSVSLGLLPPLGIGLSWLLKA